MVNKALVQMYQSLNKALFNGELPAVRFQIDITQKSVFHYRDPTIFLGSKFSQVHPRQIIDDLLHDMIHVWNRSRGVIDFTANQYHKKDFCDAALEKGLSVQRHPARGWSITSSGDSKGTNVRYPSKESSNKLKSVLAGLQKFKPLIRELQLEIKALLDEKPKKQFQLKYICECDPPVIVRSGRRPESAHPLNVVCQDCGAKFVLAVETK